MAGECNVRSFGFNNLRLDDIKVRFHDNTVQIRPNQASTLDVIEITDEYDLYINHRYVKTDAEQDKLLKEFHYIASRMGREAKKIALEGAKIGVCGAGVGLKAVARVAKLILPTYGTEDLERDMEREAERLEIRAERLEVKAECLEDKADRLDDIREVLSDEIPELEELDWF
jgi:hypothetical protein